MINGSLTTQTTPKNDCNIFNCKLKTLVIGLGETGFSTAKFLHRKKCQFDICDTRKNPPYVKELNKQFPEIKLMVKAEIDNDLINQYEQIIVSPGISIRDQVYQQYQKLGKIILGDIVLFLQENKNQDNKPVIAVTGSNGKSTVVTLVEHMFKQAGHKVVAGGNLGLPALDLLEMDVEIYILELSSFQLETIPKQCLGENLFTSSVVLNVSEDHMDRYQDIDDYRSVKETIFELSKYCVFNKNEFLLNESLKTKTHSQFSLNRPEKNEYGLINEDGKTFLAHADFLVHADYSQPNDSCRKIMPVDDIRISGKHNYSNILASLALVEPFVLSDTSIINAIKSYKGLAHRCEWVAKIAQVDFYNDSKGTNVGATIAAINSFDGSKILIAGGVGKNADFSKLAEVICTEIKHVVLFGEDAALIEQAVKQAIETYKDTEQVNKQIEKILESISLVSNMEEAINRAQLLAESNSIILFSPACASFDMYKNYIQRGNDFVRIVNQKVH